MLESLKGFEAFGAVFQTGTRFAYRGMTAFVHFRSVAQTTVQTKDERAVERVDEHGHGMRRMTLRFGVTAKKRTRPAVLRNRIKRLLRESLRIALLRRPEAVRIIEAIVLVCNVIPEKPQLLRLENVLAPVERIVQNAIKHYATQNVEHETLQDFQKPNPSSEIIA